MAKNAGMNMAKGVSIGLITGMVVGIAGKTMIEKNPRMKKKANRAMNAMSNVIDTAQYMFK